MAETREFQAESKELLQLMINSIYSNKEIFLRELISNASDAIDKYKYLELTSEGKVPGKNYGIWVEPNKKDRTLTITDNGIGMSKEELIQNLGTIAHSGSKEFLNKIKEAKEKNDLDIIGQFGVGFYSAFMVADNIEVHTKSVNENSGYVFTSNGESTYSIDEEDIKDSGTRIVLHLRKNEEDENYDKYLENYEIESLVKRYSDFVRYPIKMKVVEKVSKENKDDKDFTDGEEQTVIKTLNSMIPLWKKNKSEVTDEDLNSFYKANFNDFDDPLLSINLNVEGMVSFNSLIFVPSHIPYDLYSQNYEKGLKL